MNSHRPVCGSACVFGFLGGGEMEEANAAMKEPPKVVLRCKLCMVGDAAVGKTALTEVYTKGGSKFPKNYSMVGVVPPVKGATRSHSVLSLQTGDPTFTVHVVDIEDTNMRVELCIFDVPGDLYCRESSLKLVRADHHAYLALFVAAPM